MLGRPTVITPHAGKKRRPGSRPRPTTRSPRRTTRWSPTSRSSTSRRTPKRIRNRRRTRRSPGRAKATSGSTFAPEMLAALDVKQVQADYDLPLGGRQKPKKGTDFPSCAAGGRARPRPGLPDDPQVGRRRVPRRRPALGRDGLPGRRRATSASTTATATRTTRRTAGESDRQAQGRRRHGPRANPRPDAGARRAGPPSPPASPRSTGHHHRRLGRSASAWSASGEPAPEHDRARDRAAVEPLHQGDQPPRCALAAATRRSLMRPSSSRSTVARHHDRQHVWIWRGLGPTDGRRRSTTHRAPDGWMRADPAGVMGRSDPARRPARALAVLDPLREAWGTHRITIHLIESTQTFGRGGVLHPRGTNAGSAGCIDLDDQGGLRPPPRRDAAETKVKLTVAFP